MANTLTNLILDAYVALDIVSRERSGFIPSIQRDSTADRLAQGQTLRVPVVPANAAGGDITPAMSLPSAADQTIGNKTITLTKSRFMPFSWSGEQQNDVNQGPGFLTIQQNQIAQGIRALVNEMEADIATAAYKGASRGIGPNDTSLFKTNLADAAQVRKILDDNGAPASGRSLVINTTAGAALRTLAQLTKANEAGTQATLRDGELLNIHGLSIKESAQIVTPAVGTSSTAVVSNAGYAVGTTSLVLKAAGTGTIVAGDLITIADDTNVYTVVTGAAAVSGATIVIAAPGLRKAIGAAEKAITITASTARNVAFEQSAICLATRIPVTMHGDLATMREVITDPRTGLSFEIVSWPGADMVTYHVRACWGVSVIKPEHVACLYA